MVITSAVGLGVLCLALLGPVLISLGLNKLTVGSICAMSGAVSLVLLGASWCFDSSRRKGYAA
ncbi:hypothetical protein [Campylobacter concisus]